MNELVEICSRRANVAKNSIDSCCQIGFIWISEIYLLKGQSNVFFFYWIKCGLLLMESLSWCDNGVEYALYLNIYIVHTHTRAYTFNRVKLLTIKYIEETIMWNEIQAKQMLFLSSCRHSSAIFFFFFVFFSFHLYFVLLCDPVLQLNKFARISCEYFVARRCACVFVFLIFTIRL